MVFLVTSMTLPLNHIFVLLLANVDVIPKQKQLNTVSNTKENLIHVIHNKTKRQQAPVVQKVDNVIHRINLYPVDSAIGFSNIYPPDSD